MWSNEVDLLRYLTTLLLTDCDHKSYVFHAQKMYYSYYC